MWVLFFGCLNIELSWHCIYQIGTSGRRRFEHGKKTSWMIYVYIYEASSANESQVSNMTHTNLNLIVQFDTVYNWYSSEIYLVMRNKLSVVTDVSYRDSYPKPFTLYNLNLYLFILNSLSDSILFVNALTLTKPISIYAVVLLQFWSSYWKQSGFSCCSWNC